MHFYVLILCRHLTDIREKPTAITQSDAKFVKKNALQKEKSDLSSAETTISNLNIKNVNDWLKNQITSRNDAQLFKKDKILTMMEQKTLGSKFSQTNHKDRNLHVKIVEENDLKEKKELAQDFATILQEKKDL